MILNPSARRARRLIIRAARSLSCSTRTALLRASTSASPQTLSASSRRASPSTPTSPAHGSRISPSPINRKYTRGCRHAAALFSPGGGKFCKYIDLFAESDIIEPQPMGSSYGLPIRLSPTAQELCWQRTLAALAVNEARPLADLFCRRSFLRDTR